MHFCAGGKVLVSSAAHMSETITVIHTERLTLRNLARKTSALRRCLRHVETKHSFGLEAHCLKLFQRY